MVIIKQCGKEERGQKLTLSLFLYAHTILTGYPNRIVCDTIIFIFINKYNNGEK